MALLPSPVPPPDGYRGAAGGTASPPDSIAATAPRGVRGGAPPSPGPPPGELIDPRAPRHRDEYRRCTPLHAAARRCTPPPATRRHAAPRPAGAAPPVGHAAARRRPPSPTRPAPLRPGGEPWGRPPAGLPSCRPAAPPADPRGPPGRRLRAPAGRGPAGRPRRPGRGPWTDFELAVFRAERRSLSFYIYRLALRVCQHRKAASQPPPSQPPASSCPNPEPLMLGRDLAAYFDCQTHLSRPSPAERLEGKRSGLEFCGGLSTAPVIYLSSHSR
jgi:hypothetical protein